MKPIEDLKAMVEAEAMASAQKALRDVRLVLPHLSGLAQLVRLQLDTRCETAGVFASGRLVLNPAWWSTLKASEAVFVMAHEILHLALGTHARKDRENGRLVNIAHDLIINDILEHELGNPTPALGLRLPGARNHSLEWLVGELRKGELPTKSSPRTSKPAAFNGLELAHSKSGRLQSLKGLERTSMDSSDVLGTELEIEWFPDEPAAARAKRHDEVQVGAIKAVSIAVGRDRIAEALRPSWGFGGTPGNELLYLDLVEKAYAPPWERQLQRWFEGNTQSRRTFSRASRRGADRSDQVVLPGRSRAGDTLHLILDTSGSMLCVLNRLLGTLIAFAEANQVDGFRMIQADGYAPVEEWVPTHEIPRMALRGLGGGNLALPLEHFAKDPTVESVVVVTDGEEPIMDRAPHFDVLWALPYDNPHFNPGYGTIMVLPEADP